MLKSLHSLKYDNRLLKVQLNKIKRESNKFQKMLHQNESNLNSF